jgi:hypothetical protein
MNEENVAKQTDRRTEIEKRMDSAALRVALRFLTTRHGPLGKYRRATA